MVFDESTAQDDHTRVEAVHGQLVDHSQVSEDVDHQPWVTEGMEEEHVTKTPICQGWAEYGNIIFIRPIVYGFFIVDLFSKSVNYFAWSPTQGKS